ncbi:hypothetical protein [Priestia aryabhattai]|uniref:hypothetical protein n=1 Tax=Priestia aryabhattai TaxID=412384 RepID=UPI0014820134|nr:hypothetical protein [Priestia aryabhattai]
MEWPCGKSGKDEPPQERERRGSSPAPRGKRSLAQKSTACNKRSILAPVSNLFVFRLK